MEAARTLTVNTPDDIIGRWILIRQRVNVRVCRVRQARFEFEPGVSAASTAAAPVTVRFSYEYESREDRRGTVETDNRLLVGTDVALATDEQIESWIRATDKLAAKEAKPLRVESFVIPALAGTTGYILAGLSSPAPGNLPIWIAVAVVVPAVLAFVAVTIASRFFSGTAAATRDAELSVWAACRAAQAALPAATE